MKIVLEGIMIVIMIVIILIAALIAFGPFFAPRTSSYYYNQTASLYQSACTSPQIGSNFQFDSPPSTVLQIYDNSTCDSLLSGYKNMFANQSFESTTSLGYELCYARLNTSGYGGLIKTYLNNQQFFFNITNSQKLTYLTTLPPSLFGVTSAVYDMPYFSPANVLSSMGFQVDAAQTNLSGSSQVIGFGQTSLFYTGNDVISILVYSNNSANFQIYPSDDIGCSDFFSYNPANPPKEPIDLSLPCNFSTSGLVINPTVINNQGVTQYQFNLSIYPITQNLTSQNAALFDQCEALPGLVSNSYLDNGSIYCAPVNCGGNNFFIANTYNKPLLGFVGGSYSSIGFESGPGDLQIIDPNSETITQYPLTEKFTTLP
ncbi:hypothetical protein M1293_01595 [Candidatus Parvarchaeota archaeon]|nr:hypothetical protein [Candidatus Parvarchaeota archaeon]